MKVCIDLRSNLILTKVIASHRKSTQVHARPVQTDSHVDLSLHVHVVLVSPFGPGFTVAIRVGLFCWGGACK